MVLAEELVIMELVGNQKVVDKYFSIYEIRREKNKR